MSKHTKGPWVIVRGDEWTTDIATVEGELPDGRPAHWNVASVNKQRDEWEQNRLLIAAAPELYEAVAAVIDAARDYLPPDGITMDEFISRVISATDNARLAEIMK